MLARTARPAVWRVDTRPTRGHMRNAAAQPYRGPAIACRGAASVDVHCGRRRRRALLTPRVCGTLVRRPSPPRAEAQAQVRVTERRGEEVASTAGAWRCSGARAEVVRLVLQVPAWMCS